MGAEGDVELLYIILTKSVRKPALLFIIYSNQEFWIFRLRPKS